MGSNKDSGSDKVLVGCKVSRGKSERWSEFVTESTEYNSKAQLIRAGVERIVAGEGDSTSEDIEELRDGIEELKRDVNDSRSVIVDLVQSMDDAEEIAEETVYRLEEVLGDE